MSTTRVTTDIDEAVAVLAAGGIVGLPTETVYGLAARVSDEAAVRRVFSAKGRPADHPLIVHVSSLSQALAYGEFDERATALAVRFWPGPVTLLVRRRDTVPLVVTGGRDTVAIRVPAHPMALELIDRIGEGLVAPSANRFGRVSPTDASHVVADLDGLVDLVLDGGRCTVGVESTIVDCTGTLQVLRPGAVTADQIEEAAAAEVGGATGPSRAPGMLASHYAPRCALEAFETAALLSVRLAEAKAMGVAVTSIGPGEGDVSEYSRGLYASMRAADEGGADLILALLPEPTGLGLAVRDRLLKAAAKR